MNSELPNYLKSLEAILGGGAPNMTTPTQSVSSNTNQPSATTSNSPSPNSVSVSPGPNFFTTAMTTATPTPNGTPGNSSADKKLRFMLVSTHAHQFTGYSKVSYNMLQQLSRVPWLQVTHYGFQKFPQTPPGYRTYPSNIEVIDAAATEKDKGQQQQEPDLRY